MLTIWSSLKQWRSENVHRSQNQPFLRLLVGQTGMIQTPVPLLTAESSSIDLWVFGSCWGSGWRGRPRNCPHSGPSASERLAPWHPNQRGPLLCRCSASCTWWVDPGREEIQLSIWNMSIWKSPTEWENLTQDAGQYRNRFLQTSVKFRR